MTASLRPTQPRLPTAAWATIALVAAAVFALLVTPYFGPIVLGGDAGQWSFVGHYFVQNLSLLPVPSITLETDWTHYPYGADHTFLHWAFERDLVVGLANRHFGPGPWLQLYFLASLFATALGCFLALRIIHDPRLAFAVAMALGFCNFYALSKFPSHLPHSCLHWTAVGIALDYVAVRLVATGASLSLPLLLSRALLLLLSLGLELGYVAGFSLMSALWSYGWIILLLALRRPEGPAARAGVLSKPPASVLPTTTPSSPFDFGRPPRSRVLASRTSRRFPCGWFRLRGVWRDSFLRWCASEAEAARSKAIWLGALGLSVLVAGWFYLPLAFQVAGSAAAHDAPAVSFRTKVHPLRLFLPYLPGVSPATVGPHFLGDRAEASSYDFSPGLAFVLAASLSLASKRRRALIAAPFLAMLASCLMFRPPEIPTLHLLPWFHFARVPGRSTMIFPVLLAAVALSGAPFDWRKRRVRAAGALVVSLLAIETATSYRLIRQERILPLKSASPRPELWRLLEEIRQSSGEAIFEWPFAISGETSLAAFESSLKGVFQFAPFHEKKGLSAHFGRQLAPTTAPLLNHGWGSLFFPESVPGRRVRQRRDFAESEWEFLTEFVTLGNYAGILLYPDLLPRETVAGFYSRFGAPSARATAFQSLGTIEFIPKPAALRARENPTAVRALRLRRPFFRLPADGRLDLGSREVEDFLRHGWGNPNGSVRRTIARRAAVAFALDEPTPLRFRVTLARGRSQRIVVLVNGMAVDALKLAAADRSFEFRVPGEFLSDRNLLIFDFPDARTRKTRLRVEQQAIHAKEIVIHLAGSSDPPREPRTARPGTPKLEHGLLSPRTAEAPRSALNSNLG